MARRRLRVVTAVLAVCCGSCSYQEFPATLDIDDQFTDEEVGSIAWAVGRWNGSVSARRGDPGPVIILGGRVADEFDLGDLGDDRHVIYRIERPDSDEGKLFAGMDSPVGFVGGHATLGDVTILSYALHRIGDGEEAYYAPVFRAVVLHELGHLLGIQHFSNRPGIMDPTLSGDQYADPRIEEADLDAFCIENGCD